MSDSAAKRFGERDDFQVLSSQSDILKSSYHKNSLWMAHWTRTSSSAEPQSCSPFEEIGDVGYSKDCRALPSELSKARMSERMMLGVSSAGASAGNTQQFSSKMWGVTHNASQGVECKNVDQVDRSYGSSMMQKNVNLYAADTVVSERFSVHKLSDIPVNSRKVLSSNNLSSEWNHFPMFEINRKIDSILNPRRSAFGTSADRSFVPQKALKVNMSTSNVMTFSSKEYQFHAHRITDENMSKCRSAGGILSHLDNHIGLNSDHAGNKLKGHLSIEESCSCSKNETNSSCSLTDKHCTSNLIVNSKESAHWSSEKNFMFSASKKENENVEDTHREKNLGASNSKESAHWSSEKNFMFSASKKENENVEDTHREKNLGASGGCQKQQDFETVAFYGPVHGRENEMKPVNDSPTSKENALETSVRGTVFANLLHCEQENMSTHGVDSSVKLTESCELLDTIENTAVGKPPERKLTDNKGKSRCLFEMLTVPSKSHTCFKDPTSSARSCGNMGSCLLGAQKQFSTKTGTLDSDTHYTSGFAATSIQKDSDCPNATKSEQRATSSIRGMSSRCGGNETLSVTAEKQNSCSKAILASKQEWTTSKTSSLNLDLVLFQISRMRNPISNALVVSPLCSEPSDKWLKRLQHDISDPHFPCSKRLKVGNGPPPGGTCTVSGQKLDYDIGNTDVINHVEEDQLRYGRLMNQQDQEGPPISTKSLNRWIGRWCQDGTPIFHGASNIEKQTSKSNSPSDDLEGQFPSIAAMAMMGRVMSKLRPCELQKKGPSVVWTTQGL
ncbi:hypothetical protein ACP70R_038090 [Stipagrostis hirtigluma subsp. patula]